MYRLSINFSLHRHVDVISNEFMNVYSVSDYMLDADTLLFKAENLHTTWYEHH